MFVRWPVCLQLTSGLKKEALLACQFTYSSSPVVGKTVVSEELQMRPNGHTKSCLPPPDTCALPPRTPCDYEKKKNVVCVTEAR